MWTWPSTGPCTGMSPKTGRGPRTRNQRTQAKFRWAPCRWLAVWIRQCEWSVSTERSGGRSWARSTRPRSTRSQWRCRLIELHPFWLLEILDSRWSGRCPRRYRLDSNSWRLLSSPKRRVGPNSYSYSSAIFHLCLFILSQCDWRHRPHLRFRLYLLNFHLIFDYFSLN